MFRRLSLLVPAVLSCGCYAYYPISSPPAPDQRRFMVTLNDSGTFLLAPKLGAFSSDVEGTLVARPDSVYQMSVVAVHRLTGSDDAWRGERVSIPVRLTTTVTERHFSVGRTALFSAGIVVIATVIRGAFTGNNSSGGSGGVGPVVGR